MINKKSKNITKYIYINEKVMNKGFKDKLIKYL